MVAFLMIAVIVLEKKNNSQIMQRGSLYWDESSRGHKKGKTDKRGRWCAEKTIDGRRIRRRSVNMDKCLEFLKDCDIVDRLETRYDADETQVPSFHDTRFMIAKGNRLNMAQRKERLENVIKEAQMTLTYWESRDFKEINAYIEKKILPRLNFYCTNRLGLRQEQNSVVLEAIAILYTQLYSDIPVYSYEGRLKTMLRYYKNHNGFGYYDEVPEPVHQAVESMDLSNLQKKFIVKRL